MENKVIASISTGGFQSICPELHEALKEIANRMRVKPSPLLKGKTSNWQEATEMPYWFLAHHLCMNGAQVISRHSDLEPDDAIMSKSLPPSYKICLHKEDSIDEFCKRILSSDYFAPAQMGIKIGDEGFDFEDIYPSSSRH